MELSRALDADSTLLRDRIDRGAGRLVGTACAECGTASWPGRAVCHRCGSAACDDTAFSPEGRLITYTRVWVPRPGLEPPYILGQIELPEGVRVFGHIRELRPDDRVPLPVRLVVAPDEGAIPPFWFEPLEIA